MLNPAYDFSRLSLNLIIARTINSVRGGRAGPPAKALLFLQAKQARLRCRGRIGFDRHAGANENPQMALPPSGEDAHSPCAL